MLRLRFRLLVFLAVVGPVLLISGALRGRSVSPQQPQAPLVSVKDCRADHLWPYVWTDGQNPNIQTLTAYGPPKTIDFGAALSPNRRVTSDEYEDHVAQLDNKLPKHQF